MNTTQLECFLAVANTLNFSRAADRLQITQPAVSHQIRTLEDELGVQLFNRNSKQVRLTQEGHLFIQYAGDLLKLMDLSRTRVRASQATRPARLGIGCRNTLELQLLRSPLTQLYREIPNLLPVLRLIPFDSLEKLLEDGEIHMMFCYREAAPQHAAYRELAKYPVVCICSPEHPLAQQQAVTIEQLMHSGQIAVCRPPICPPSLFALQSQIATTHKPGQLLFCETQEVVYTLAETGFAFALTMDFPTAHRPGLRYIPVIGAAALSWGAACLPHSRNTALRRFLHLLEQRLQPGFTTFAAQGDESPAPSAPAAPGSAPSTPLPQRD